MSAEDRAVSIGAAALLAAVGGATLYVEHTLRGAGPASAVRYHGTSLAKGDLQNLENSATAAVYLQYQTQASRPVYVELQNILNDRIPSLARPTWSSLREQARSAAAVEYRVLRDEATSLGRAHYQQLTPDERRRIVESGSFDRYIVEEGVRQLPPDKRTRVSDPGAFYRREDRSAYLDREAWRHVSDDDKELLVSPRALDEADTPEKLTYFDRIAIPQLTSGEQTLLGPVDRSDTTSLEHFVSLHGQRLLSERLARSPLLITGLSRPTCRSAAFERGALLHGSVSGCTVGDGVAFALTRDRFKWLVADVTGLDLGPDS